MRNDGFRLIPWKEDLWFHCLIALAVYIRILWKVTTWRSVWTPQVLISNSSRLSQSRQQCTMNRGRVISDRVFSSKEYARWVLDHVISFSRVSGNNRGCQNVVVISTASSWHKTKKVIRDKSQESEFFATIQVWKVWPKPSEGRKPNTLIIVIFTIGYNL